jgi:hypothetical protein
MFKIWDSIEKNLCAGMKFGRLLAYFPNSGAITISGAIEARATHETKTLIGFF